MRWVISLRRALGSSYRSSNRLSRDSAGGELLCCIPTFPTHALLKIAARPVHRVFAVQEIVRCPMEMLCRCLDGTADTNNRNQGIKRFLIQRLVCFRRSHDQLESKSSVELHHLVDVVRIELFERLVHQQQGGLRWHLLAATEMIVIRRRCSNAQANIEGDELLSAACLPTTLLKI